MRVINYFECGVCGCKHLTVERALNCEKSHCKPVRFLENTAIGKRYRNDRDDVLCELTGEIAPTYPNELLVEMDNGAVAKYSFYGIERRYSNAGCSADAGGNSDSVPQQSDVAEAGADDA